jgi:hypothetical protein
MHAKEELTRKAKADLIDEKIIEFEDNFGILEEHMEVI